MALGAHRAKPVVHCRGEAGDVGSQAPSSFRRGSCWAAIRQQRRLSREAVVPLQRRCLVLLAVLVCGVKCGLRGGRHACGQGHGLGDGEGQGGGHVHCPVG